MLDAIRDQTRFAVVLGGDDDFRFAMHELLAHPAVTDQLFDAHDRNVVSRADGLQLLVIGHPFAVAAADFDEHADGAMPAHAGEIDGRLGVPGATQNASVLREQRIDVPGTDELLCLRDRICQGTDRPSSCPRTHARSRIDVIDRNKERRAMRGGVVLVGDDRRETQPIGRVARHRRAQHAPAVLQHEIDHLGRDGLGDGDEVPLVLTLVRIDDDHQPTRTERCDGVFNGVKLPFDLEHHDPRP